MVRGDYLGLAVCLGFGLWWVLFPDSVISFYTRLMLRPVALPRASIIRVIGGLWIAFVLAVTVSAYR